MDTIRISGSDVGHEELSAIERVFCEGYLGMGREVKEFETELSDFVGREAVCVSTGTASLQLALEALGIGIGDEVLVPSLSYVAAFQAISATGATPVPIDVDLESLTISIPDLKRAITGQSKVIMPVHYAGGVGDIDAVYQVANQSGLRVVEDAAHAFGSKTKGRIVGSFGDVTCFSFDPIKNITSIEGGAVVSADEAVLESVRNKRLLGVIGDSEARHRQQRLYEFDVVDQGWRYHMSNVNAAVGRVQLRRFSDAAKIRQRLAHQYAEELSQLASIRTLALDFDEIVPHIYVVMLPDPEARARVKTHLKKELNVDTGLHWFPNHLLSRYKGNARDLPNTMKAYSRMLTLPLHTKLTPEDVRRVAEKVVEVSSSANR